MTLLYSGSCGRWARGLAFAGVAAAGYVFGITSDRLSAQPGPAAQPKAQPQPEPDRRTVAYVYGTVSITREELGDFLIARGGYDKLELLVNKKIIEIEAARRNVTVTSIEVKAGLEEDLRGLNIKLEDFVKVVLPRYGKSLYEWTEDVIKPRILLTKMCKDRVKVTEDDLKKAFENKYGEQRQAKIICWNKEDLRAAQKQWDEARKSDADFDRIARMQADPNLAAACGLVKPTGRNIEAKDGTVEKVLFNLKVGEISQLIPVDAGIMCVKCVAVIPPDDKVKFDDKIRESLHKEMYDKRLSQEIPKFFNELKTAAKPNVLLKGPPSVAEFEQGVKKIVEQSGVNPAGGLPAVTVPKP